VLTNTVADHDWISSPAWPTYASAAEVRPGTFVDCGVQSDCQPVSVAGKYRGSVYSSPFNRLQRGHGTSGNSSMGSMLEHLFA